MRLPDLRGLTVSEEIVILDSWVAEAQSRVRALMGVGETDATVQMDPYWPMGPITKGTEVG